MRKFRLLLLCCSVIWVSSADARLPYLGNWQAIYPDSNADDINGTGCQLCHQADTGNEPWNAYGWAIREVWLANNGDIDEAINLAADIDHDSDPKSATSSTEIANHFQPGWTEGAVNTLYFKSGTTQTNQPPPSFSETTTALDFPTQISAPIPDIATGAITIDLHEVAGGFNAPLRAVQAPGIDGSLFVVEQTGKIFRVDLSTGEKTLFHDTQADLVAISPDYDERGLLGLAFHPQFQSNGLFYTYQSEPTRPEQDDDVDFSTMPLGVSPDHRSMVVEYQASDSSCNSFITKRNTLMIIDQPQFNHNGGDLVFGPDGFLYIALGDGGYKNDEGTGHGAKGTARENSNPLGAILRIDVDGNNAANMNYGVPADNPFVGTGGVDEIFAYGFRNPFRMSFDATAGDLYVGDVGQNEIEEIDQVVSGANYGWNWQEGNYYFYNPGSSSGAYISETPHLDLEAGLQAPLAEYDHGDGISVIGGYVYRGSQVPVLQGRYVFAEFNKRLFYLDEAAEILEFLGSGTGDFVTGFGEDVDNEIYVVTNETFNPQGVAGKLLKIMASGADYVPP
ncbi:MAG: hypothetical protein HKN50_09130, partial [Gammaproteobacteria bacterium]|nr:hypothetical protein [Gammaproteobacteria bacterium]